MFGKRRDTFDPRRTAGTRSWWKRGLQGRNKTGQFIRMFEVPIETLESDDLDMFCAMQQARIVGRFAARDMSRNEQRWVDGQWVGRSGLELMEVRR